MNSKTLPGRCELSYSPGRKVFQAQFFTDREPHIVAYTKWSDSWDKFTVVACFAGVRGMPKNDELPATVRAEVRIS